MNQFHLPTRRAVLGLACAAALGAGSTFGGAAWAADKYPSRPIRLIVPLPAGGPADVIVRIQAQQLEKVLKQPVIIENRPGGSYTIGLNAIAAAPADGYTLMAVNVSMVSTQVTLKKLDLIKSLIPVGRIAETPAMLVVSGKSPVKTVGDLLAQAKASPGRLSYGVGGAGSAEHLLAVTMEQTAGFKATMIPFKGTVDGMTALVGGDIDYQVVPLPLAAQFIPKGTARGLAVFSAKRLKEFPDVPTIAEAGIAISPFTFWGGLAVAAGTPADVVQELHRAIAEANSSPDTQAKLAAIGASASTSPSPQAFAKEFADEIERMSAAVKAGNIKLEQ